MLLRRVWCCWLGWDGVIDLTQDPSGLCQVLSLCQVMTERSATRGFWKNIFTDLTGKFVSYQ